MIKLVKQIKQSLPLRLSLSILAFTVIIFMITIGIIFVRTRHFVSDYHRNHLRSYTAFRQADSHRTGDSDP